jgi:hypothetical protein
MPSYEYPSNAEFVDYKQLQIHQKHAFNQKKWHEKI